PYLIYKPLGISRYSCKTQADGRFEIHRGKGLMLDIEDISLKGYEYHEYQNETRFDYQTDMTKRHVPDKANPVVFRIRRKNPERVYLYQRSMRELYLDNRKWKIAGYDLAQQTHGRHNELLSGRRPIFCDLEMSGEFDEEARQWTVTFTANGENAGLLPISEEKLYEAPSDGYRKSVTMHLSEKENYVEKHCKNKDGYVYLYARLRDPGYYARLEIPYLYSGNGSSDNYHYVCFETRHVFINPYGTRCLEHLYTYPDDTDARDKLHRKLDWDERDKLYDTIDQAFRNQELVPMPDFRKLGKGGKDIID
ncbi:MAG: hypothetical protein IKP58_03730, partial [Victivallales bacterium]|nr:hypothetical protein [Victivallales bacterium]